MAIQNHTDAPLWSLDDIEPYGSNPKDHPEEQIDKIASSLRRFGWNQSIVVDGEGVIIVGHGRRLAAKQLDETEVPVTQRTDLSEAEARAYRIADNKVSESSWDIDLLGVELELLDESTVDTQLTGFDDDEIEAFGVDDEGEAEELDPREEWEKSGIADYENEDQLAEYSVKVNFMDEQSIKEFSELVGQKVTTRTDSIWFPEQEGQKSSKFKGWVNET
jgi:ParB-like chromosome segregation protein Spo0J